MGTTTIQGKAVLLKSGGVIIFHYPNEQNFSIFNTDPRTGDGYLFNAWVRDIL